MKAIRACRLIYCPIRVLDSSVASNATEIMDYRDDKHHYSSFLSVFYSLDYIRRDKSTTSKVVFTFIASN